MPDRLKKIVAVFDDDGVNPPTLIREYKSVHHEGEGAPRDVEITAAERQAHFAAASATNARMVAEAQQAKADAEEAARVATVKAATRKAERDNALTRAIAAEAERDTALAQAAKLSRAPKP